MNIETGPLVLAILVQAGALLVWGGRLQAMLTDHHRRLGELEDRHNSTAPEHSEFRARLDSLERGNP
jgi:hypothetical protein